MKNKTVLMIAIGLATGIAAGKVLLGKNQDREKPIVEQREAVVLPFHVHEMVWGRDDESVAA